MGQGHDDAVLSQGLGALQGQLRRVDEFLRGLAVFRIDRYADGDRRLQVFRPEDGSDCLDALAPLIGPFGHDVDGGPGQDQEELLPAAAAWDIPGTHGSDQELSQGLEDQIARLGAVRVVDGPEAVDVDHGCADGIVFPGCPGQFPRQGFLCVAAVEQARQVVADGLFLELGLQVFDVPSVDLEQLMGLLQFDLVVPCVA